MRSFIMQSLIEELRVHILRVIVYDGGLSCGGVGGAGGVKGVGGVGFVCRWWSCGTLKNLPLYSFHLSPFASCVGCSTSTPRFPPCRTSTSPWPLLTLTAVAKRKPA